MAEIKIQKKKPVWPWVLLVVVIILFVVFLLMNNDERNERYDATTEQVEGTDGFMNSEDNK